MRVLQISKTPAGAAWAARQVAELVALGLEVHVAVPPGEPMPARFAAAGATVHEVDLNLPRRPRQVRSVVRTMRRLVGEVGPDVLHSHFVGTTLTMRLALGRRHPIPRLFQVAGPLHLEHPAFRWSEISSAGPLDAWIASCRWTRDRYVTSGIHPDRVHLSYLGTDVRAFSDLRTGKLRAELGLGADRPVVGMVAYMYAPKRYLGQRRGLKGHEDLVDAAALLVGRHPGLVVVFVGGPWNGRVDYERQVRRYAADRLGDRAVFTGHRDDVAEIYADFDVAVHPSHSENVGGAVESLLCGVPTVASDVGGLPDVVIPGETGWLAPAGDPAALAEAIAAALADPRVARRLAARGRELVGEMFDVASTAREVAGIYERVATGRPAAA